MVSIFCSIFSIAYSQRRPLQDVRRRRLRTSRATSARTSRASQAAQPRRPNRATRTAHAANDAAHRRRRFPPSQTAPPDRRWPLDNRRERRQKQTAAGGSPTTSPAHRDRRKIHDLGEPSPPVPANRDLGAPAIQQAPPPPDPAHRGQRPEQPWNERIGGSLWSFSLSKARAALERTLEPDVQNRRTVGRAHSLRNRQILAVAIPDALPGKQEGVGGKQVVDHV